jgi:hypothetical protein
MVESAFGTFDPVLGATAAAFIDTGAVQRTPDDVVTHPGEILNTATTYQDNTVFLKAVPFVRNVRDHLISTGQANLCHFADGRIRFLGRTGHDLCTDTATKRIFTQGRRLALGSTHSAWFADQLVDCRHGYRFELRKSGRT